MSADASKRGRASRAKGQRGYVNLDVTGILIGAVIVGSVVGIALWMLVLDYLWPWAWALLKPWLHGVTA